jgi:hypothetical protein
MTGHWKHEGSMGISFELLIVLYPKKGSIRTVPMIHPMIHPDYFIILSQLPTIPTVLSALPFLYRQ